MYNICALGYMPMFCVVGEKIEIWILYIYINQYYHIYVYISHYFTDVSKHDVVKTKPTGSPRVLSIPEPLVPTISNRSLSNEPSGLELSLPLISDLTLEQSEPPSSRSSSIDSITSLPPVVARNQSGASTPPIVSTLMDMGFSRAQVNIALNR